MSLVNAFLSTGLLGVTRGIGAFGGLENIGSISRIVLFSSTIETRFLLPKPGFLKIPPLDVDLLMDIG